MAIAVVLIAGLVGNTTSACAKEVDASATPAPAKPVPASPPPTNVAPTSSPGKPSEPLRVPAEKPTEPLGSPGPLQLAPGSEIAGSIHETFKAEEARRWTHEKQTPFVLGATPFQLVTIEQMGEGAALAILTPNGGKKRVVGTYNAYLGGNGGSLTVVRAQPDPSGTAGFVLCAIAAEGRAYDNVQASEDHSYVVVGFTADRAWLASEPIDGFDSVLLDDAGGSLRLVGCRAKNKKAKAILLLDPQTAMFTPKKVAAGALPAVCPTAAPAAQRR